MDWVPEVNFFFSFACVYFSQRSIWNVGIPSADLSVPRKVCDTMH